MHKSSLLRMQWFVDNYLRGDSRCSVLDVGSYNVNGTYRSMFEDPRFTYLGLDMAAGPNVDLVPGNPYIWKEIEKDSFDVVISGQVLEHAEFFWLTMAEITRVVRPGGLICIIAPRGFAQHRNPVDCYRFDTDGMVALARWCNLTPLHASRNRAPSQDLPEWFAERDQDSMLVARKPGNWSGMLDVGTYVFRQPDMEALATGMKTMKR